MRPPTRASRPAEQQRAERCRRGPVAAGAPFARIRASCGRGRSRSTRPGGASGRGSGSVSPEGPARLAALAERRVLAVGLMAALAVDHPWVREHFHGPRARVA